jgi:protein-S-isoprenylcysteine O-methyltransferase Ste14
VRHWLQVIGWMFCVPCSTVPIFWLMIHPFAERWRQRPRSPYFFLLPAWMAFWLLAARVTWPARNVLIYPANLRASLPWLGAGLLFACGLYVYFRARENFSASQLSGLPEVHAGNGEQRLITQGIRARVRHPVYLAYLCWMLGWSVGTGLAVCWGLTAFAIVTGAAMIRMEDAELENRFGEPYRAYRNSVPAVFPRMFGY